jgi:O-antigen/teichoic acid export membrane protein
MSLIRNSSWSAFAALVLTAGRFSLTILLARKLGVTEFGKFTFAQWAVDMIFLLIAFGLPGSATRFFAEFRTSCSKLVAYERWYMSRSTIAVAAVVLTSPVVTFIVTGNVELRFAVLLGCWTASTAGWALLLARAQGLQRFKRVAISNLIFVVFALAGCALLPDQHAKLSNAISLVTAATSAAALAAWLPLPCRFLKSAQESEKANLDQKVLRTFGFNIWVNSLVSAMVWSRGEIIFIRSELGVAEVGVYSIALSLTGIATQGMMLLTGAIGPHLTQMWGASMYAESIDLGRRITDVITFAAGCLVMSIICFAPELISYSFGSEYIESSATLAILAIGALGLTSVASNQLLQIRTNGLFARNANLLGSIALFATALPLVLLMGNVGAALSRMSIQVGIGVATMYFACTIVGEGLVSWANQVKVAILVIVVFGLISVLNPSLEYRGLIFGFALIVHASWLRNQIGKSVFRDMLAIIKSTLSPRTCQRAVK